MIETIQIQGLSTHVRGFTTTRFEGCSEGAYASLNLGDHVNDAPLHVQENRRRLAEMLPSDPIWMDQVHGARVVDVARLDPNQKPQVDGLLTATPGQVLAVLTADCLPIVLADDAGQTLAVVHAGWRGLAAGVVQNAVKAMKHKASDLGPWRAWIGPCISGPAFQVGQEVREAFLGDMPALRTAFKSDDAPHKWRCDLSAIARDLLLQSGASEVQCAGLCTVLDSAGRFFSYRRDGETGRIATVAWLTRG